MIPDAIGKATTRAVLLVLLICGLSSSGVVQTGVNTYAFRGASVKGDTTDPSPIQARSCNSYAWFQKNEGNWESEGYSIGGIGGTSLSSLHEMTCKWAAYQKGLSLDSTRLPKYVRPVGDSLRLSSDVLAYPVTMGPTEDAPLYIHETLYLVADIRDSLYYHKIVDARPRRESTTVSVRALRTLDVRKANAQYIWFEYAKGGPKRNVPQLTWQRWKGHIFTYDRQRGFRHLQEAPIRKEIRKNGRIVGAKQWDVSVTEAGVMLIERRLQKGKDVNLAPPEHWLGQHVIDSQATDVEPRPSPN